uniref:Uncharacterized protein n=1 Tax=Oryza meridionalis TaxID=40149 RepID=A0A0E0FCR5_9ORYZ
MVPGSNARCGSGGIGRRWRRRRRRRRPGAAVVEGSRSAKRTARLKGRRAAREALFGWAGNGRDRGPIPVDHPGEEIIPAHTKLCPGPPRVSLFCKPGKKSSTREEQKNSSRQRNEDTDATAGAARGTTRRRRRWHGSLLRPPPSLRDIPDNLFDGSNFLRFLKIYCFRKYDESHGIIIVSPAARLIPLINLFSL